MVDGGSAKTAVPPLTGVPPVVPGWFPVPLLLLLQAAAVTATAAMPQAAANAPRVRVRRHDGNTPIVRSSLLIVVKTGMPAGPAFLALEIPRSRSRQDEP